VAVGNHDVVWPDRVLELHWCDGALVLRDLERESALGALCALQVQGYLKNLRFAQGP
jgi:hypothetical protein